jgi:hypothetical protein
MAGSSPRLLLLANATKVFFKSTNFLHEMRVLGTGRCQRIFHQVVLEVDRTKGGFVLRDSEIQPLAFSLVRLFVCRLLACCSPGIVGTEAAVVATGGECHCLSQEK